MAAQISTQQLSEAVCKTIKDGTYPDDEVVISAELDSPALESLAQMLTQAREEVKSSIRELSQINAGEVDGWISEAKQLRKDLEDSQKQTSDIGKLAAQRRELENIALDANHKVDFLKRELTFNGKLTNTLENVLAVRNTIDGAQDALLSKDLRACTNLLRQADKQLSSLEGCQRTSMINLLRAKIIDIRDNLAKTALYCWSRLVVADHEQGRLKVASRFDKNANTSIENTSHVLQSLDLLKGRIIQLKNDAEIMIFKSMVGKSASRNKRSVKIEGPVIETIVDDAEFSVERMLANVSAAFNYFSLILPQEIAPQLLSILAPSVVGQMIAESLAASVPPDLSGIATFAENLERVKHFANTMNARKWPGAEKLQQWVQDAPIVWLHHRTNSSLSSIRLLLARGLGKPRSVERVETQQVLVEEEEPIPEADERTDEQEIAQENEPPAEQEDEADEGDDWGEDWGWGDEDEQDGDKEPGSASGGKDDGFDEDDWGWGDEDQTGSPVKARPPSPKKKQPSGKKAQAAVKKGAPSPRKAPPSPKKTRPKQAPPSPRKRAPVSKEVTLRETYHITAVPEQIIEIVVQAADDAESLTASGAQNYAVIHAAGEGLFTLPELILSMLRACAPNFYARDASGNMYLYNDSLYLVEQLRAYASHHASTHAPASGENQGAHLDISSDILALETFGKGCYGKEMETQRTIVRDLLEGAQGFAHCTTAPFKDACELAVSSAIDRLQQLHAQWQHVLSPSALQQSLGSLLATATGKLCADVQDLEDIAEPESRQLVAFCQRLEQLELLFLPPEERAAEGQEQEEQMAAKAAMAASIYTPGLLKFQWLAQLLEGTLADIRFWWNESELSLAFSPEETIDLIEALFADSEHRRKTIAAIKSAARG